MFAGHFKGFFIVAAVILMVYPIFIAIHFVHPQHLLFGVFKNTFRSKEFTVVNY